MANTDEQSTSRLAKIHFCGCKDASLSASTYAAELLAEILIDHTSFETFTYPLVLNCGHTYDKSTIDQLKIKICPECRTDIRTTCVNWYIVKLLNLNIPQQSTNSKYANLTKEKMRDITNTYYRQKIDKNIPNILTTMVDLSHKGFSNYNVKLITMDILDCGDLIAAELKALGYHIEYKSGETIISVRW